jgi:hypothetical protein
VIWTCPYFRRGIGTNGDWHLSLFPSLFHPTGPAQKGTGRIGSVWREKGRILPRNLDLSQTAPAGPVPKGNQNGHASQGCTLCAKTSPYSNVPSPVPISIAGPGSCANDCDTGTGRQSDRFRGERQIACANGVNLVGGRCVKITIVGQGRGQIDQPRPARNGVN